MAWIQTVVDNMAACFQKEAGGAGSLGVTALNAALRRGGFRGSQAQATLVIGHGEGEWMLSEQEFRARVAGMGHIQLRVISLRSSLGRLPNAATGFLEYNEVKVSTESAAFELPECELMRLQAALAHASVDGKVSIEELLRVFEIEMTAFSMEQVFCALDRDNSGYLGRDEILCSTREPALRLCGPLLDALLVAWVLDKDNRLNYKEFVEAWRKKKLNPEWESMTQVFHALDRDGSGYLDRGELLRSSQAHATLQLPPQAFSDLLTAWVKDDDNRITYSEFVDIWKSGMEKRGKFMS